MLSKYILRAAATAAALTCTTGSASAEEFQVMIMDQSFFPEASYVQPGDTVTFVNMSGASRVVQARNNIWATPVLENGAEATINIVQGMPSSFLSRIQGSGGNSNDGTGESADTDSVTFDLSETEGLENEPGTIMGILNLNEPTKATVTD
jgi:plastocyanin